MSASGEVPPPKFSPISLLLKKNWTLFRRGGTLLSSCIQASLTLSLIIVLPLLMSSLEKAEVDKEMDHENGAPEKAGVFGWAGGHGLASFRPVSDRFPTSVKYTHSICAPQSMSAQCEHNLDIKTVIRNRKWPPL